MTEVCLVGNWVCAQGRVMEVYWEISDMDNSWVMQWDFCWKIPDGPRLDNIYGSMVDKWNGKGLGARDGGFLRMFQSDLGLVKWKDLWSENTDGTQLGYLLHFFGNMEWTPAW